MGGKLRYRKGGKKSVKFGAKCNETTQNFKTSYLGLGMNFLVIISAQNDRLVIGYLIGKEIFELWPYLCLWQLFKRVTVNAFWPILQKVPKL